MVRLEHLGIAVQNPEAVAQLFAQLFEIVPYKSEVVSSEFVQTIFLSVDNAKLELLHATSPDSAVAKYLDKKGEGLHHVAFEVADLDAAFLRLKEAGFQILNPEPKAGADGKRIFFLHPKQTHGMLIEFCASTSDPLIRQPLHTSDLTGFALGNSEQPTILCLCEDLETIDVPLLNALVGHYFIQVVQVDDSCNLDALLTDESGGTQNPMLLLAQDSTCTKALIWANEHPEAVRGVCLMAFAFEKAATKALAQLQQPLLLVCNENHLEAPHYFSLRSFVKDVQIAVLPASVSLDKSAVSSQPLILKSLIQTRF